MSVDGRIREGLQAPEETWLPETALAYDAVLTGARRRTVRRRAATGAVAAVVLAGTAFALRPDGSPAGGPAPGPGAGQSPSVVHLATRPGPLDGTWRSGWIQPGQLDTALRGSGLGHWTARWHQVNEPGRIRVGLVFRDGVLVTRITSVHGRQIVDEQTYWVEGHSLTYRHSYSNATRTDYTWRIQGSTLRLHFLRTSEHAHEGLPAEVSQRVLYAIVPFTRVSG